MYAQQDDEDLYEEAESLRPMINDLFDEIISGNGERADASSKIVKILKQAEPDDISDMSTEIFSQYQNDDLDKAR